MKISKIKKLCKACGQIIKTEVVTDESVLKGRSERVFLGTENAKYRLNSFYAEFEPEDFADLWEISSKAQDKMFMDSEVDNLSDEFGKVFRDSVKGEAPVVPLAFSFMFGEAEWKVFVTEGRRFVFVPAAELVPVDLTDEERSFYLRGEHLAIKKGMYLEGIVAIPKVELSPVLSAALKRLCEIADSISEEGAGSDGE